MARRQSDRTLGSDGPRVATVSGLAVRVGLFLTVLSLPLAVGASLVLVLTAPSISVGLDHVLAATSGPLGAPDGVGWLAHVAVLGLLAGSWLAGAGLLAAELAD